MPRLKSFKKDSAVLGYLSRYGAITRHNALTHFRVWDLPKIACRLKAKGHDIKSNGLAGDDLKYTLGNISEKFKSKSATL